MYNNTILLKNHCFRWVTHQHSRASCVQIEKLFLTVSREKHGVPSMFVLAEIGSKTFVKWDAFKICRLIGTCIVFERLQVSPTVFIGRWATYEEKGEWIKVTKSIIYFLYVNLYCISLLQRTRSYAQLSNVLSYD